MNNKGSLNFVGMFTFAMIIVLFTAGTGYLVGYATTAYNVTPNFEQAGVDVINNTSGLDYFINGTQLFNQSVTNTTLADDTSLIEGGNFVRTSISGTSQILTDIVGLTPLGAYGSLISSAIAVIFVAISAILILQFFFNRSLN